ncbi:MAG: hypothetical protein ACYCOU_07075 [Sulfobacillus sp.]
MTPVRCRVVFDFHHTQKLFLSRALARAVPGRLPDPRDPAMIPSATRCDPGRRRRATTARQDAPGGGHDPMGSSIDLVPGLVTVGLFTLAALVIAWASHRDHPKPRTPRKRK